MEKKRLGRRRFLADLLFAGGGLVAAALLLRFPEAEGEQAPAAPAPPPQARVETPAPPEEVRVKGDYVMPQAGECLPPTPLTDQGTVVTGRQQKNLGQPSR